MFSHHYIEMPEGLLLSMKTHGNSLRILKTNTLLRHQTIDRSGSLIMFEFCDLENTLFPLFSVSTLYFGGAPKSLQMVSATMKLKDACSLEERAPLVAQMVKHLPAMWETRVQSLGWEYPLEKEMATCSSILVWRIP